MAFVALLLNAPIKKIALENPQGCIGTRIRPATQYIQPYDYGHDASKRTGLWLKNLPPLLPTKVINPRYSCGCGHIFEYELGKYGCPDCLGNNKVRPIWANQTPSGQNKLGPSDDRAKIRSLTYQGIADAMAQQWGQNEQNQPDIILD